jgi:hypothetical protein
VPANSLKETATPELQGETTVGRTIAISDGGEITDNHYKNHRLGFRMDFPEGWLLFSNKTAQASMEQNEKKIEEEHPGLTSDSKRRIAQAPLLVVGEATAYKNGTKRRSFKLLANEVSGEPHPGTGLDYLNALASMAKKGTLPIEFLSAPEPRDINEKRFGRAYARMSWEGVSWYVALYAIHDRNYVLQFIYVSPDRDGLADLEPWIGSIRFDLQATKP